MHNAFQSARSISSFPCRRPSGLDTEFFLQLFLEQSEKGKWTVGEMLRKSMEDQQITFAAVCVWHDHLSVHEYIFQNIVGSTVNLLCLFVFRLLRG